MPRIPRRNVISQTQIFHVINRGILRQEIFHDDQDVSYFLDTLCRYKEKFDFEMYHWCVMPNHYHLLAKFVDGTLLSKIIGACQQIYVKYYHRKYETAGKLFQNRFKSQAIEMQSYLLACGRYIELNPVRASLVKDAWEWPWSSASYYVLQKKDKLTSVNTEFKEFYLNIDTYKQSLKDVASAQKQDNIFRSSLSIIGSDIFRKQHIVQNGHSLLRKRGRPVGKIKL